jgi:hypothetical protein
MKKIFLKKLKKEQWLEEIKNDYTKFCSIDYCSKRFEIESEKIKEILIELDIFEKRRCTKCKLWKPFNEFHLYSRSPSGITTRCKICRNLNGVEYYSREEIKERHNKYLRNYNKTEKAKQLKRNYTNERNIDESYYFTHSKISISLNDQLKKK